MPYKCVGSVLYHKKGGKWSVKQHTSSSENCQKAMGLLHGLESGSIKKSQVGKPKSKSKSKYKILNRRG